ncbi:MAG: amidohydrolase family protein [Ancalomicrobiaceae bacterium]|nr:amidohydrolase family protein [Ancalomicrobiaceae bacterium]
MIESLTVGPDKTGRVVAITGGRIDAEPIAGAATLCCPDGVIETGAVCAHTHLYSGLAPYGMPAPRPEPLNFLQVLERVWWRLDRAIDAESLSAAARLYVAEALLSGTTALVDHHESPTFIEGSLAVLAEACEAFGIRALLSYGATERNFGREEATRGLAESARVGSGPRIRGLIGLHAGFTVSDDTIKAAADLAYRRGTAIHIHVAEDLEDVDDAQRQGYAGPIERMEALGALVPGSVLAHGVHLTAEEVALAAKHKCWLVQNPRSNATNRVGYPYELWASPRVALGTDGWPANMVEEQRVLMQLAAMHSDDGAERRLPAGNQLIAEHFGAAGAGLTRGGLGDLVVTVGGAVKHVVVDGRVVVRDGALIGHDIDAVRAEAKAASSRLWDRMAQVA